MFVFSFFGTFAAMTQNSQVDLTTLTMDLMANMPFGWILLLSALAGVPAFLLLRGKKMFTEDLVTVNERLNAPSFFAMLAIILGCAGLLQFALILIESVLQLVGLSLPAGGAPSLESIMSPLVILHVMLIAPIFEEIMFRGAILRTLRPYGSNFAIVVSALLFALTHIYLYQATFAFFIGIVLAYCTLRFSIKWAMLLHIVNNSIAMGLTLIDPTGTLTLVSYGVFVVLAIVAGVWGFKKFSQQRRDGKPTEMACVLGIAPNPYVTATPGGSSTGSGGINAGSGPSAHVESAPFPRARPLAIAFSSPWLIAVIALMFCASMLFLVFSPPVF
jgi:membrane protease YdiL (CAAX protease family)